MGGNGGQKKNYNCFLIGIMLFSIRALSIERHNSYIELIALFVTLYLNANLLPCNGIK